VPLNPTIFHQPWWMEIASEGCGRETVVSSGGMIVGRLPYLLEKRFGGLTVIGMPAFSHVLGPGFSAPVSRTGASTIKMYGLINELLAQLPKASHISFRLHGGFTETLAFAAAGFSCDAEFTVVIKPASRDILWRQMRDKTRNIIRRAEEILSVSETSDPDLFLDFYEENLRKRGRHNQYDRRIAHDLIHACLQRKVGRILISSDGTRMHSAVFTIWDAEAEYYFMSTRMPDAHNGAVNLLIWKALQVASEAGRTFDMDGLHVVNKQIPNLLLLNGFGGVVVPRFYVRRTNTVLKLGLALNDLLKHRGGTA
jgi:hypothetical protein